MTFGCVLGVRVKCITSKLLKELFYFPSPCPIQDFCFQTSLGLAFNAFLQTTVASAEDDVFAIDGESSEMDGYFE